MLGSGARERSSRIISPPKKRSTTSAVTAHCPHAEFSYDQCAGSALVSFDYAAWQNSASRPSATSMSPSVKTIAPSSQKCAMELSLLLLYHRRRDNKYRP